MIRRFLLFWLLSLLSYSGRSQFTLASDDKVLQLSGYVVPFFNYRFYAPEETNLSKNRFNMDFAVIRFDGMSGKHVHYEIQLNMPAVFSPDLSDEFLMQSTIEWRTRKDHFNVRLGYDKIPFSRASLNPQTASIFMQRPEMVRGKTFNRRDCGVTIEKNFFNKRLNFYGGVYTGQGINSIIGDNDNNGKFLYAGRVEASYPARSRFEEADLHHVPIPNFAAAASAMYSEKTVTTGTDYPILTVDGQKFSYEYDVSVAYKGFTLLGEYAAYKITPNDTTLLYGKPTNYYIANGYYILGTYAATKINSVFGVRYDSFNPSDLVLHDANNTLSLGYDYMIDGFNSVIKIHFFKRLKDGTVNAWSEDQIRIGWQYKF
jgi:Phosphate-selective porin O and P